MIDPTTLDFDKSGGLIPVVVQDAATLQVLTLAYMDRAALDETLASGEATFFSRSRGGRPSSVNVILLSRHSIDVHTHVWSPSQDTFSPGPSRCFARSSHASD